MTVPAPAETLPNRRRRTAALAALSLLFVIAGCNNDDNDEHDDDDEVPDVVLGKNDPLPGVVVEITTLRGGTTASGAFRVGDVITVDFTVKRDNGDPQELSTMARGAIMVSGPTFNYQRVIASQSDVLTRAVKTGRGAYRYTFAVPIPATYLPPLNDTPALTDGELTGQPLLAGTYTVGIELRKDYTVAGEVFRDPGNATRDFLLGSATELEPRELVTLANCNQCHGELRAHGDNRNNITNCLLCHTAGAEDRNTPGVANGTPGAAIDFKVMIHKIHAGKHLPSVLGVTTNPDGSRKYDATPKPYQLIGFNDTLHDWSEVGFPTWPSLFTPMPRDTGYTALGSAQQALENTMRSGPVDCGKCHGDPDGDGPLPAPAQGDLIYAQPTRAACASCHDDWVPELPYIANGMPMPPQLDDAQCKFCHPPSGSPLAVRDGHLHPLRDPALATGVHFEITAITEVGGNSDDTFDPGEKIGVTFQVTDDNGAPVAASSLSRIELMLNGPTTNPNMVHLVRVGRPLLTGNGPYTINVPAQYYLEPVGVSTGTNGETFTTSRAPHWNVTDALTTVFRRTASGASSTLASNAPAGQNHVDLAPGGGASFANGDSIVLEDGVPGRREFLRVQWVEGDRLWFSSMYRADFPPRLSFAHAPGSAVQVVTLTTVPTTSYSLDRLTGLITETTEFGNGEILCSYTSDFVVPSTYPGSLNESPELDETWGDWTGLPLLSGTYTLGLSGARTFAVTVAGTPSETTNYTEGGKAATRLLRFGDATTVQAVNRIDSIASCNSCHHDIQFHGGSRRGVETCVLCHTTAGAEDAPRYTYPAAAATPETTVDFRTMLHKIHHGKELAEGASYVVVGNGGASHTYEHVGYPFMPGGTRNCASCHGAANTAWVEPASRDHPSQNRPTRVWRAACASCHDSSPAVAHIDANTSPSGQESCSVCHGSSKDLNVRSVHTSR